MFTFLKVSKGFVIEKLSISRHSRPSTTMTTHQPLLTISTPLNIKANVKAKNHYHYKIKETFLIQYLNPAFNVNVSREKLML